MALRGTPGVRTLAGLILVLLVVAGPAAVPGATRGVQPNSPATFVVNSTGDAPDASPGDAVCDAGGAVCTLRAAIEEANANTGADTIHFAIGTGPQTIAPSSPLPVLSETVTIDATTQPGFAGTPLIEIDGAGVGANGHGFQLSPGTSGSTVKGLLVNRFPQDGISISGNNTTVENCIVGTDVTRTLNRGNGSEGISIYADGNMVRNNVVAFSGNNGVVVYDGENSAYPAFTALTPDQTMLFPSVDFSDNCGSFRHASDPIIVDTSGRPFNEQFGMRLTATMNIPMTGSYNFNFAQLDDQARLVIDSVEWLNATGPGGGNVDVNLTSGDHAIEIDFHEGGGAARLLLQVSGPGTPTFTYSASPGLQGELFQMTVPSENNTITQNSIFDNAAQGIALGCCCIDNNDAGDIDIGANGFLNFPEITNHFVNGNGSITIQGTAPVGSVVEVFASSNDPSGRGEGKVYLTTSAIVQGDGAFIATFNLPQPYYTVTTTATDAAGNTSEFSPTQFVLPHPIAVTTNADSGAGSLRAAIFEANGDGVDSLISFDPSLNGSAISLGSPLPALTENGTTINGDLNSDCRPDIELNGGGSVSTAITINSQLNTIRGLAIRFVSNEAILIDGGAAQNNAVVCNFLGTNLAGTNATGPGSYGVHVRNGASNNAVGRLGEGNLITLFTEGVRIDGGANNTVAENTIGFDVSGNPLAPPQRGVQIINSNNNWIGVFDGGNRIIGTTGGIDASGGSGNQFRANWIGWPEGTPAPLGYGIRLHSGAANGSIGDPGTGQGNRIENNGGSGVRLDSANADGVSIRGNLISKNGGLGIDLDGDGVTPNDGAYDTDTGANEDLNFPVLTRATTDGFNTTIEGLIDTPVGGLQLDFYASAERDPSGYGEGATYLQTQNLSQGSFSVSLPPLPVGTWITATTNAGSNTSEFSLAIEVTGKPVGPTELVASPVHPNAIALRWRDPQSSETGFRVERSFDGVNFGQQTTVGPDTTTWTDVAVGPQQTFAYRIVATSAAGDSPPSNVAWATSYSTLALNLCRTMISDPHQFADSASAVHNGTNWAVAWSDKRNGREADIYFQKLDNATGATIGSPVQITNDDVSSRFPTLAWSGSQYGLLWFDHLRQPNGASGSRFSFALLDGLGSKVRGDIRLGTGNPGGPFNPDAQMPLIWDGSGWGVFLLETPPGGVQQVVFYRLAPNGDVLVNGVTALNTTAAKSNVSAAWNGTEYAFVYVVSPNGLRFVRMQPNGTAIGSFVVLGSTPNATTVGTNIVWDGSGWAVVWSDVLSTGEEVVSMRRVDASGNPLGTGPTRLSDDGAVNDELPRLVNKPGGGFFVYTTTADTDVEVGLLQADASGSRVGSRTFVSPVDGFESIAPRVATNGSSMLVAWEEASVNPSEIAAAVVSGSGTPGAMQSVTTGHNPPVSSSGISVVPQTQNGFVTVWSDDYLSSSQLNARLVRQNGSFVDRRPLTSPADPARRPAVVGRADTFAVAWTDRATGAARFQNFDFNGLSLGPAYDIATGVNVNRGVGLDFDGQFWGAVWVQSNQLRFQRLGPVAPVQVPTIITGTVGGPDPKVQWVGSGWAVVWNAFQNLWYARLDPSGALIVPPTRVTDSGGGPTDFQLVWNGSELGLSWGETSSGLFCTVIDLSGIKAFAPVPVVNSADSLRVSSLYFDGTNFHVVCPTVANGIRDVAISTDGVVSPATQFDGNHGEGRISATYNGATLAMAWQHLGGISMQTSACLLDNTPPSCASLNGTFSSGAVQLNWPNASDAQSGILAYHLYRDGILLAELLPSTLSHADGGFTPGFAHVYELRPFNGAYLEATGCATRTVIAGIVVSPTTLPNAKQNQNYNATISASQGTPPYGFNVTSGSLPANLNLNSGNGQITGQPVSTGAFSFTVTATDNVGSTGSRNYTLRVCPQTTIAPTVLPDPIASTAYSQVISVSGTSDPTTFAVTSGALPAGLTLAANGTLSGTPTATGAFTFSVTATESTGCTTTQSYSFTVVSGLAPRDVQADPQSTSSILVRWVRPQRGETGFRIERSTDAITWGAINNVGADVTSLVDSGLSPSSLYYYRVVAFAGSVDAGTSNVTAAMTNTGIAGKACQRPIYVVHQRAQYASVAHDGTRWGAVWQDRKSGQLEDLYFQFLDNATGAPAGSPIRITQTDMPTRFSSVRWNGSQYGVLYTENLRGPAGELASTTSFALIDSAGAIQRRGVRVLNTTGGALNSNLVLPLEWDGAGWGVFASEARGNPPADLYYWRLTPSGDVATGPVRLTNTPGWDYELSVAWNGTEYGLAWVEYRDLSSKVLFQRMQVDGTLIGSSIQLAQSDPNADLTMTSLSWNGSEWAVAYASSSNETALCLRRLNPDGSPIAASVRVSDDANPSQPIDDNTPVLVPKAGGGYLLFTVSFSYTGNTYEVARLEADASGNRAGSRVMLTPEGDGLGTQLVHMATDGTRFLLAHEQESSTQQEVASLITNAAGVVTNGPTPITSGHPFGASQSNVIQRLGSGFVVLSNAVNLGSQMIAKIYDSNGNETASRVPLSPTTGVRSRIGAVSVGSTFAVAWRDTTSLRFCRYDSAGNPLFAEVVLPSTGTQAGLGWNGEHYGLVFFEGGSLRFQRLNSNGALNGPKVSVGSGISGAAPQIVWAGTGWAIVWRKNTDLYYALLDRNGAFIVQPLQVTFTGTNENNPQIAWSGDRLGLVWNENRGIDPPGSDIYFTVLRPDGTKDFAPETLVSTPFGDGSATVYWSGDRFWIVYSNPLGGTREMSVLIDGTIVPGERVYHNRNLGMSVAWNGIALGMAFSGLYDLTFQNSACFDDVTAPSCPNVSTSFDGARVRLTWPAVGDAESGILGYNVYRDGAPLAELAGTTLLFDDFGFVSGATHTYEVRAVNGAYRESSGCTLRTVVAGVSVNPATLPNGSVGGNYSQTLTGSQGTAPYTFAVTAGTLPANLALNGTSGVLTGVPQAGGLFNFTVTATDAIARTGSRAYVLRVCNGISLFPTVLIDGYVDRAYSQTILPTGANGTVALSITSGAIPAGLVIDGAGWIHGTPAAEGTSSFAILATDSTGCTTSRSYTIVIQNGQAVRDLSAFALTASSIRLRWVDPQRNETSFRIDRSTDFGANWSTVFIVGPDTITWTDTALAAGTTYSYRVVANLPAGVATASNVATGSTFPATAAKTCLQPVSPYHPSARAPSMAWNGSQWAMVWQERTGGAEDDLFFTFLDANGAMTGSPVQVTSVPMGSLRPSLRWNGSKFGVMWIEIHRGPNGEAVNEYRFALLAATGAVIRTDVMIPRPGPEFSSAGNNDMQFFWDGTAWSFFETHFTNDGLMDIFFYRFDEDGDILAGPTRLTTHADFDIGLSVAWNGTEYAMAWGRFRDDLSSIEFQRVSSSGALVGSPVTLAPTSIVSVGSPDITATPSGWAVVWRELFDIGGNAVWLQRLSAAGALVGAKTRVNDDFDLNGFTPADQRPANDSFPDVYALVDGSFVIFTTAQLAATGRQEVAMLHADSSGARVGTRLVLSTQDTFNSNVFRVATNGTDFLVGYNELRLGTQEIADLITTPAGTLVAGPTDLTSGHSIGLVVNTSVAAVGNGFAALFLEPLDPNTNRVYARIFDGTGALSASKSPLSTRAARGRAAIVGVGSTFATVLKDSSNNVVFGRWDASGNALITEVNVATGAGGSANVNVGFDGETYGVLWIQGGRLNFQRVSPTGVLLGPRSTLSPLTDGQPQQMVWTAQGWAIVFVSGNDVYYTLLDAAGATIVAPIRMSFTPTFDKVGLALAWNGDVLGLAYTNYPIVDPPGLVVEFTAVDLAGIKQFSEVVVAAEGRFDNTIQGLYWDADRFKVVFSPGEGGALRSVDVSANGTILGPSRMLSNRGFGASVAFSGVTAGMTWLQTGDLYFQTSACLADVTPPTCPALAAARNANGVTLTWTPAADAESTIYRYVIYRNGVILGDAPATFTTYTDRSVRPADTFTYEVRAQNGAFLLSTGCSTQTVPPSLSPPSSVIAASISASQIQISWVAVSGADSYNVERSANGVTFAPAGSSPTTSFNDTTVTAGVSYLYRVRAVASGNPSDPSGVDLATAISFTDDPLVTGTLVKLVHLTEMRTAVNAVRQLAGLPAATWTPASEGSTIAAVHFTELRTALSTGLTTLGFSAPTFTDTLTAGTTSMKTIHVQEVRNAVK